MSQTSHGRETVVARRVMAQTYWSVRKLIRQHDFDSARRALYHMAYVLNDWTETDYSYGHGHYAEERLGELYAYHSGLNQLHGEDHDDMHDPLMHLLGFDDCFEDDED